MSEWKTYAIEELFDISSGLSKPRDQFGFGTPFLSFKNVFKNFFVPRELTELVNATEKEKQRCSIMEGDIFFTRTSEEESELGMSSVALQNYPNATFNGFTKRLRLKKDVNTSLDPVFAGYLFRSPGFRKKLVRTATITTRASLNNSTLNALEISLPDFDLQKSIGRLLKSFDDKTSLLRRQNQTLEKIAQTLFKRWFIDFEFPNEEGKPYRSSGGAMRASELGEIPTEWYEGKLGDILYLNYGKTLKAKDRKGGNFPVVGSSGIIGFHSDFVVQAPGIVIGRKGTIGKVIWLDRNFYPIDTTFYISDKMGVKALYYHYFLLEKQRFDRIGSDSAVPGLNRNQALDLEEVIPPSHIVSEFQESVEPIFNKMELNKRAIQTLIKTRDALLPKLMNGQIRIKDLEHHKT